MEQFKKILGYIEAALLFLFAGLAFFFRASRDKANSRVGQLEADKKMAEILTLKEEAEDEAIAKELAYKRARDGFLRDPGDSSSDPK